jgi:hypothetical protein
MSNRTESKTLTNGNILTSILCGAIIAVGSLSMATASDAPTLSPAQTAMNIRTATSDHASTGNLVMSDRDERGRGGSLASK